jgi:hypothetical protein
MHREEHDFSEIDAMIGYLLQETSLSPADATETVGITMDDGIVVIDNGRVHGIIEWEITYDDGAFHVIRTSGHLAPDARIT